MQAVVKKIEAFLPKILVPVLAVIAAVALSMLFIQFLGKSVPTAFGALLEGAVGSRYYRGETIVNTIPLLFTGLSFALASRCGLINIGGEGQLYMGAVCSTGVALFVRGVPGWLLVTLVVMAGFLGGGIWGLIAGLLKTRFGASELITTIMLNYIAIYFANFMVTYPYRDSPSNPQSKAIEAIAQLPRFVEGTRIHAGLILALLFVLLYYIFLWKMKSGFETRVVGLNPSAAEYAGINTKQKTVLAMFLAGGLAGLAGTMEIVGVQYRMRQDFSPGYGYDGIAVALLGEGSPVGILVSALLFGALRAGANLMQVSAQVPTAVVYVVQALVVIFVIGSRFMTDVREKLAIRKEAKEDR